jgi:hypothetical protein
MQRINKDYSNETTTIFFSIIPLIDSATRRNEHYIDHLPRAVCRAGVSHAGISSPRIDWGSCD